MSEQKMRWWMWTNPNGTIQCAFYAYDRLGVPHLLCTHELKPEADHDG